jgi:hypothetical protein
MPIPETSDRGGVWELALRGLELGLEEAVRIYVVNQLDFSLPTRRD